MTHDPLCPIAQPCVDVPRHGFCSWQQTHCIHCYRDCQCHLIAKVRAGEREKCERPSGANMFQQDLARDMQDPEFRTEFYRAWLMLRGGAP